MNCLKLKLVFALLLLLFSTSISAQSQKFLTLNDTVFEIGQVYRFDPVLFYTTRPLSDKAISVVLDSVVQFLINNSDLLIEMGVHTDTRSTDSLNMVLSGKRAEYLCAKLIELGVDSCQLVCREYGETLPLVPHEEILKMQDARQRELAHLLNERVELKILGIRKRPY